MKDFDQEKVAREEATRGEREFTLGGQTFYAKASVRPEVMLDFEGIATETPPAQVLAVADKLVIDMIEGDDDAEARYRELRTTDAVDMTTLLELCQWLIETVTNRPTEQPSGSSALPETPTAGTASTEDSSSEDSPEG
jgi:hypothetical protein